VREMTAFGGKREKGVWKEKKPCMPVCGGSVVVLVCCWCEDRIERNVRKTVVTKKTTAMRILGGRILYAES
jgi:hypothetical protein